MPVELEVSSSDDVCVLAIDLSPTWLPDQVQFVGREQTVAWHLSALPAGGTRLHVELPATGAFDEELVVAVRASSTVPGGRGPLELPRVRPLGTQIADEAWLAWVDQATITRPISAQGLAWIDPNQVPGLRPTHVADPDLRTALAWRWTAPSATHRIDRERIESEPGASITCPRSIRFGWRAALSQGSARRECRLGGARFGTDLDQRAHRLACHFGLPRRSRAKLETRPLDERARLRLGLPTAGSGFELQVNVAGQTARTINFRLERPWNSNGSIPVVSLPRKFLLRGLVVVDTPAGLHSRIKTVGLPARSDRYRSPRGGAGQEIEGAILEGRSAAKDSLAISLTYTEIDVPQLELFTEPRTVAHRRHHPGSALDDIGRPAGSVPESAAPARQFRRGAVTRARVSPETQGGACPSRWI